MNAGEFYQALKQQIKTAVDRVKPYRAKVSSTTSGLVNIQTYDADTPLGEHYPQLAGMMLSPNDEVAVIDLDGKPFVLGRIKRSLSGRNSVNTVEGAFYIESASANALTVLNRTTSEEAFRVNADTKGAVLGGRLTSGALSVTPSSNSSDSLVVKNSAGSDVFRVNTSTGDAVLTGVLNLDGVVADKVALTPPRFFQASSATSGVTSTTNTTTYQSAITRSYTLGAGTWTVYLLGGQMLRHSAEGGAAYRVRVGGSASSGIVTGFYATAYTQGIDSHVVTGQTGTIDLAVEYRSSSAGTTTSKAPWLLMLAVRTA